MAGQMDNAYQWVPFYEALADKLLTYSGRRGELHELMKKAAAGQPYMEYLHFDREDWWASRPIDPFSVIGVLNRKMKDANRTALAKVLADTFGVKLPAPTQFTGIPVLNNMSSFFSGTDEVWALFVLAMHESATGVLSSEFKSAFGKALAVSGNGLVYITMGLYWVRPKAFMPLDGYSRAFAADHYGVTAPGGSCSGEEYVSFLSALKEKAGEQTPGLSFPEISHAAWTQKGAGTAAEASPDAQAAPTNTAPEQAGGFSMDRNIILHGVPGTGKTYSTVLYAVSIIEETPFEIIKSAAGTPAGYQAVFKRYLKYKEDGLIAFTTFHQSFGYEEFIEGIRPVVSSDEKAESGRDIEYRVCDGIFKAFCDNAGMPVGGGDGADLGFGKNPGVWKVSLNPYNDSRLKQYCFSHGCARLGKYDIDGPITDATDFSPRGGSVVKTFHNKIKVGDIIVSPRSNREIDGIGVVTGDAVWLEEDDRGDMDDYRRSLPVKWLATDIAVDVVSQNAGKTMVPPAVAGLSITPNDIMDILRQVNPELFIGDTRIPNRVFIIDEINRGNISKIFGELITLIEPSKRIGASEQLKATLPYSGLCFGVPDNVYILGTMNTADRSIAMIDTALRRRFSFMEMLPDPGLLQGVHVEGIDIAGLLATMNRRLAALLDREHAVGHSYFLPLVQEEGRTMENLARVFKGKILPLLQEYFYDDYGKIQLVLGDNQKKEQDVPFIVKLQDVNALFGDSEDYPDCYEINDDAFGRPEAYAFFK